jgi:hypothetical protein
MNAFNNLGDGYINWTNIKNNINSYLQ